MLLFFLVSDLASNFYVLTFILLQVQEDSSRSTLLPFGQASRQFFYDSCVGTMCRVGDTSLGSVFCETCSAHAEHLYVADLCARRAGELVCIASE
jgi:hypothetical protein